MAGKSKGTAEPVMCPVCPSSLSCRVLLSSPFFSGRDRAESPVAGVSASPGEGAMQGCTTLPAEAEGTIGEQEEDQPCTSEGER